MPIHEKLLEKLNHLIDIGLSLSVEKDITKFLEKILFITKELTNADGGTLYFLTPEKTLHFEIALSSSLGLHVGGTAKTPVPFPDLPLFLEDGQKNDRLMVTFAANHKQTVNVEDAYQEKGFDFSGTRLFDENTGYRTRAVLTVPMKNHEDEVIAVLQLINPVNPDTGELTVFSNEDQKLVEALASQAAIALTNQTLIQNLKRLFESLIHLISDAVDAKSPFLANHGKRVPVIALMLAQAVSASEKEPFKEIHFDKKELYELEVAALLHDCGKITTPVHLIEKDTKLKGVLDGIETINMRFEVLLEKAYSEMLMKKLKWFENRYSEFFMQGKYDFELYEREYNQKREHLQDLFHFIEKCNRGLEPIGSESLAKLKEVSSLDWKESKPLLTDEEHKNLSIKEGTLNEKEREIIQNHVVMTYRMLSKLDYPKELKEVPEIAVSHHERVDGKGYPRGLKKEEMSVRARILAIADIFEALSAPDRPYKKVLALSEILEKMKEMAETGHLDRDLFEVFISQKVYLEYAKKYLMPEQIDVP